MQIVRRFVLGLGLVLVVPFAGAHAHAAKAPAAQSPATAKKPLVRRVFDPKDKKKLPASYAISGNTYVSAQEYADLAGGVMDLLKQFPPSKYYFVGLGRDPAPVIAFLQNLGEKELAVNLPGTSNIGWSSYVKPGAAVVTKHIEAAIPAHILKGNRDIVVLDVTSTGKTPAIFGPYLEHYLKSKGIEKKVIKLGFSDQDIMNGGYGSQLTARIDTTKFADFQQYPWGKYEGGVSEHVRHEMGSGVTPPKETRPEYKKFRDAVRARMKQDKKLDAFLLKNQLVGTPKEMAEWAAREKIELAKEAEREKAAQAKRVQKLAKLAATATAKLQKIVAKLPQREKIEGKEPYLSENGEKLDAWLQASIAAVNEGAEESATVKLAGPNAITVPFMQEVENARAANKLRQRDYRRLMGHAIAASVMDEALIGQFKQLYKSSAYFQKEVREEAEYFLTYGNKGKREGIENMESNFRTMMAKVSPRRKLD